MSRLADRVLTRIAGKATADAGCSYYYTCKNHVKWMRMCCLNEGCSWTKIGKC